MLLLMVVVRSCNTVNIENIKISIRQLIKSEKKWADNSCYDVLIFDELGKSFLEDLIPDGCSIGVLHSRFEVVFIRQILISVVFCVFKPEKIPLHYFFGLIKSSRAKLVITYADNRLLFYDLAKNAHLCGLKTIALQNGRRTKNNDIFSRRLEAREYKVDYIGVFSDSVGALYSKFVDCEILCCGSVRNNLVPRKKGVKDQNVVAYISNWRRRESSTHAFSGVPYDQFYEAESIVCDYLAKWANERGFRVRVLSAVEEGLDEEVGFFNQFFDDWEMIPRVDLSSYSEIDKAGVVVSIDSSLGYESLSRGNKTALFPLRSVLLGWPDWRLGWPDNFADDGLFWTHSICERRFREIMDYVSKTDQSDFGRENRKEIERLLVFDEGNVKLKALISKLVDNF